MINPRPAPVPLNPMNLMRVALLSTYELGRQPFALASAAAWLRNAGHKVTCSDIAVEALQADSIREAHLVAIHLPMHTATRIAGFLIPRIREINPEVRLCAFGLYAPLADQFLRKSGVEFIAGGEFEPGLVEIADGLEREGGDNWKRTAILLGRLQFQVPDRSGLPSLARYSKLNVDGRKVAAGYTEASRGCKHLCRHCPVVPVYRGSFRVVQPDIVLADIRAQVEAGAGHISFGDPDFLNGPGHARRVVEDLHREFPSLTYDVTIKVEHLLRHSDLLPVLRETGCLLVTSAVESLDDRVLGLLAKGHTRADFERVVALTRAAGLVLNPTFIAFTPWTSRESYSDLLRTLAELGLVDAVSPIQLALRLLIPLGSGLLELDDIQAVAQPFDPGILAYPWRHPDPEMDALSKQALHTVWSGQKKGRSRREVFADLCQIAGEPLPDNFDLLPRAAIPYLDEPWYC